MKMNLVKNINIYYKKFINKHNEIVKKLLETKSKILNIQNNDKLNILNITKEEEIFIIKKDFSIINILFNCSYRKVIISDDFSDFNKYEINLEYIEEIMTDELLKNKKLINNEIFEFKYKNEDLEFKNKDICTKFKEKINEQNLILNDKITIYEYFEENKEDVNLHLKLIDDFTKLIIYINENAEKKEEISQISIYNFLDENKIEFVSDNFKNFFKEKDIFTINKLLNIYEYYQILCFNKVKETLYKYQEKNINEEQKNAIEDLIENDLKIYRNNLEIAIRKFILCYLSKEKNKENKIKKNKNNIKNYLEIEDLWEKNFFKKNENNKLLQILKILDIKINNIIPFYDICFSDAYKNYFDDVKDELKNREEEIRNKEKEKEKEDIRNFNPKDLDIDEENETEGKKNEENKNIDNDNNQNEEENEDNGDSYIDEGDDDEGENGDRY